MPSQDKEKHLKTEMQPRSIRHAPPLPATHTQTHFYTHTSRRETYQFYHIFQKSALRVKFKKRQKASFWELVKGGMNPSFKEALARWGLGS